MHSPLVVEIGRAPRPVGILSLDQAGVGRRDLVLGQPQELPALQGFRLDVQEKIVGR